MSHTISRSNVSQCVCAICSARTSYINKKPSKPEALKSLGLHLQTTQNANAVQVVLSFSDLVCQRAGTESVITFSFANKRALLICLCCIHNVLHVDMYRHIWSMQKSMAALSHESLFLLTLLCIAKTFF